MHRPPLSILLLLSLVACRSNSSKSESPPASTTQGTTEAPAKADPAKSETSRNDPSTGTQSSQPSRVGAPGIQDPASSTPPAPPEPVKVTGPSANRIEEPRNAKVGDLVKVREFHENGQLATERTERVADGPKRVRQGTMKAWHDNGQLYVEGGYDDEGRLSGHWKYWDAQGQLMREGNYEEGQREGTWVENWPNGKRRSEGFIHVGLLEGPWKYWHDNGQPLAEGEYVNSLREGMWLFWTPDGEPDAARTGTYKKNTRVQ